MDEEQRARKNARERARYALSRAENIELARERDRLKARRRRRAHADAVNEYDRLRYAQKREEIRAHRAERYAKNIGGIRDRAIAYQKRQYSEGSVLYRLKSALNAARARAWKRGMPFELKLTDLGNPTCCAVTGIAFDMTRSLRHGNLFVPSLDRIDPNKGYIVGNVRVVVHGYNLAKLNGTDADVLKLARAIVAKAEENGERLLRD